MICKVDIPSIKADIGEKIGQKIIVKGSLGRSKSFEKEATIEKAYSNIFIISSIYEFIVFSTFKNLVVIK